MLKSYFILSRHNIYLIFSSVFAQMRFVFLVSFLFFLLKSFITFFSVTLLQRLLANETVCYIFFFLICISNLANSYSSYYVRQLSLVCFIFIFFCSLFYLIDALALFCMRKLFLKKYMRKFRAFSFLMVFEFADFLRFDFVLKPEKGVCV